MTTTRPRIEVTERVDGYRRRDGGRPIRAVMEERGLTITALAELTREVDPCGVGVNWRSIGFLVSAGRSGRDACSVQAAGLIAAALATPVDELFDARTVQVVRVVPTSAQRREQADTA